jgi:hypothetical protein
MNDLNLHPPVFVSASFDGIQGYNLGILQINNFALVLIIIVIHFGSLYLMLVFRFLLIPPCSSSGLRHSLIPHLIMIGLYLLELIINCLKELSDLILHCFDLSFVLLIILSEVFTIKLLELVR